LIGLSLLIWTLSDAEAVLPLAEKINEMSHQIGDPELTAFS